MIIFLQRFSSILFRELIMIKMIKDRLHALDPSLTHSHSEIRYKVLSATLLLFKITWEYSKSSQNI